MDRFTKKKVATNDLNKKRQYSLVMFFLPLDYISTRLNQSTDSCTGHIIASYVIGSLIKKQQHFYSLFYFGKTKI